MATVLTEAEIAALLADVKPINAKYRQTLAPQRGRFSRGGQLGRRLNVTGQSGKQYRIYTQHNPAIKNSFSIGLVFCSGSHRHILIRCNGWHARHDNKLENTTIPADTFHIHRITERYQLMATKFKAAHFAVITSEYHDFDSALEFFVANYGIYLKGEPNGLERPLFDQK